MRQVSERRFQMRKLTIAALATVGTALAVPAAAQVVYHTVPGTAAIVAPAPAARVVVTPGAEAYAYVAPAAPTNVYSYSYGNYSYSRYRDVSGCNVETIRDYGSVTTHRNCY
jgi:hypothetical protein